MENKSLVICWHCTCEFDASESSFCNHIDPFPVCPFCLKCMCDFPDEIKNAFLKNCSQDLLEEKLILESKTSLKLGEILIRAGKISREQLIAAIGMQKSFNEMIGQIFVRMNAITSDELKLYLLEQKWIEPIDVKSIELDFKLIESIGKDFCVEKKIIPIEHMVINFENILRLVLFSKDDLISITKCKQLKKFAIIPYVGDQIEMSKMLQIIKDYDILILE
ncbi:MAG: hypothetical protein GY757_36055 [bacterium]|nr:hypothetical protein [bacterium]